MFEEEVRRVKADIAQEAVKRETLRNLDCFILDNSIRESTVGQLCGHTLKNKWKIYEEVRKCGFNNIVVASFAHMTVVDDHFVQQLVESGEDRSTLFAFTEATAGVKNGVMDTKTLPIGLKKMQKFGLWNPIIEVDLANKSVDTAKFTMQDVCQLLLQWIDWALAKLSSNATILVNLRDLPEAMTSETPERVFAVVSFLGSLPPEKRPFGIMYEEPTGKYLPEEVGAWTAGIRRVMNKCNWQSGKLLAHIHKRWGIGDTVQLECLINGANGVWASVCEEGAAMGHACSAITLMNLIRMGNKKVLKMYNCTYLRTAAINITKITTGREPHPKQIVYGERALDLSFDFGGIGGGRLADGEFDMAAFFGEERPIRISTLSSAAMIRQRMINLFGDDEQFTEDMAVQMKKVMLEDLNSNRKEEYMSAAGLIMLFDRAGGKLTEKMRDVVAKVEVKSQHAKNLIADVRTMWDTWDLQDEVKGDDCLQFDTFYNGFMAPYFGCFRCDDTKRALKAIDMDKDGLVDWNEFLVYLKWAIHEYPDIKDAGELLSIAFRKGLIPAMRDEVLKS